MPKGNSTFNREMEEPKDSRSKANVDVSMLDQESPPNFVTFRDRFAVEELRRDFKSSQDAILAAMENMFLKQESKLNAMSKDFEDVKDTVKFLSDNYDDIIKKSEETNKRVTALEVHSNQCKSQEKHIMDLEWKLDNLEQQARLSNIEIAELPEKRDENLMEAVLQIAEVMKFPLTKADIIDVHRVPHGNSEDRRPKNIILKLSSKILKENILAKSRLCKGVTLNQLGIKAKPEEKIFLNEHLTIKNKLLFKEARNLAKQHGYRFVWPKNGIIFVRAEVTAPVFAVRTRAELQKSNRCSHCSFEDCEL